MGKYFANDLEAKEWAASKFQALFRGRGHRRLVEQKRRDMEEARLLLVDVCNVKLLSEREALEGFDEHVAYIKSRRFKEDAGDGNVEALKKALKGKPGSVVSEVNVYKSCFRLLPNLFLPLFPPFLICSFTFI